MEGLSSKPAVCTLFGTRDRFSMGRRGVAQAVTRAMENGAQWGTERCLLAHGSPSVQPGFRQPADRWGWGPLLSISGSLVSHAVSDVCCHPSTCFLPGSGAGWGLGGLLTHDASGVLRKCQCGL